MKSKKIYGMKMPALTRGKLWRLIFFVALNLLAVLLTRVFPQMRTFGWGYIFGLVGMAILTG
ncbi:MAG TPA: hypothetical protein PKW42_12155 [bacterium]|nr:hypothetical protein [bacterium]HPP13472.1 hypothetical protein [bacterium]